MKILVLGGTRFVGRAIVESALANGHTLTLVHRGQTGDDLFRDQVETVHADRLESLQALKGRRWDVCIDTCAYVPRAVRMTADILAGSVGRYLLISTVSVYKDPATGSDEEAPVIEQGDPENEVIDADTYGFLKVLCEREAVSRFGTGTLLVRPGIVIGPHDPSDRFTYWVAQIGTSAQVVTPAGPDRPVQWIDARDLADFALQALERGLTGAFHVVGTPITLRHMLTTTREALNPACEFIELDLEKEGIQPWVDLPLVVEPGDGTFQLSNARALSAGLRTRSLADSVRDTSAWWARQGRDLKVGLSAERHEALLSK